MVDVVGALAEPVDSSDYWTTLKRRLSKEEKSELPTKCRRLKMLARDGKMRETDTLDTEGIFRLIESIPSPKAEPFKLWLAKLGKDKITKEYKEFKGLKKESLRDNMTDIEVALTDLGELATREIAKKNNPKGLNENIKVTKRGGVIASNTRKDLEKELEEKVITNNKSLDYDIINNR